MRRGLVLIEVIVVICILFILGALITAAVQDTNNRTKADPTVKIYRCVKTYVHVYGRHGYKRVDLVPIDENNRDSGLVETFDCPDTDRYAQFEAGKLYTVSSEGTIDKRREVFRTISAVKRLSE